MGLIFQVGKQKIGFTSDAGWSLQGQKLIDQYKGCTLLFLHLGTVNPKEIELIEYAGDKKKLNQKLSGEFKEIFNNHLCLTGTTTLIDEVTPKLAIVSEFGEELRGKLRSHIVKKMDEVLQSRCLPGDIGLRIKIPTKGKEYRVQCFCCKEFEGVESISTYLYSGKWSSVDALVHCCDKHTSKEVIQKAKERFG